VEPRGLLTVTSGYGPSCIFFTDGSLIEGCAGFAVHHMSVSVFGRKIQSSAGAFTAELSALFTALRHIAGVKRLPEGRLILTDSMSLIKARLSRKMHIRLTFSCMNVNNCVGACARTELR
jgi:hypothetical protein